MLRCEEVSFREWFQTFRKIAVPSSSRVKTGVPSQDGCKDPKSRTSQSVRDLGPAPRFISDLRPSGGWFITEVSGKRIGCLQQSRNLDPEDVPKRWDPTNKLRNNQKDEGLPFHTILFKLLC
jgi:hypothetical protein